MELRLRGFDSLHLIQIGFAFLGIGQLVEHTFCALRKLDNLVGQLLHLLLQFLLLGDRLSAESGPELFFKLGLFPLKLLYLVLDYLQIPGEFPLRNLRLLFFVWFGARNVLDMGFTCLFKLRARFFHLFQGVRLRLLAGGGYLARDGSLARQNIVDHRAQFAFGDVRMQIQQGFPQPFSYAKDQLLLLLLGGHLGSLLGQKGLRGNVVRELGAKKVLERLFRRGPFLFRNLAQVAKQAVQPVLLAQVAHLLGKTLAWRAHVRVGVIHHALRRVADGLQKYLFHPRSALALVLGTHPALEPRMDLPLEESLQRSGYAGIHAGGVSSDHPRPLIGEPFLGAPPLFLTAGVAVFLPFVGIQIRQISDFPARDIAGPM